jgi:hypothetical protein
MYKEIQQFRQPWLWVLLLVVFSLSVWKPVGLGIMAVFLPLFWFTRLETVIDQEGISYRWFPFQRKPRVIKWTQVEQITVRNYSPLGEFGGWGLRYSWTSTAHTVSGNWGIDIKIKGKSRSLLLGTQHPDEVLQLLEKQNLVST